MNPLKWATAGAAAGIVLMLAVMLTVLSLADEHYVTRREYEATLTAIRQDVRDIKVDVGALRDERTPRRKD